MRFGLYLCFRSMISVRQCKDYAGTRGALPADARSHLSDCMTFAVEVLLTRSGIDAFGTRYETPAQRLRYELKLALVHTSDGTPRGIFVQDEHCRPIARKDDRAIYLHSLRLNRNARVNPFIELASSRDAILVRQDGRQKHGRPMQLSLKEASRTALSTITTAEFPHLYASSRDTGERPIPGN